MKSKLRATVVAGMVVQRKQNFLLVQELKGYDKGKWWLPSGQVDFGENPVCSAEREFFEETGYHARATAFLGVFSVRRLDREPKSPRHALRFIFTGELLDVKPRAKIDTAQARWFSRQEIRLLALRTKDLTEILDRYMEGVRYPLDVISHNEELR